MDDIHRGPPGAINNFKILLTVPHATCEPESKSVSKHPCDAAALTASRLLANFLKKLSKNRVDVTLIAGSVPRSVVDMNRSASRIGESALKERSDIEKWVTETVGYGRAIVDVHSYDDLAAWFKGVDVSAAEQHCRHCHPLVFLDIKPYSPFSVMVAKRVSSLASNSIPAQIVEGTTENDILFVARERYGVPCILTEFYEGSMRELTFTAKVLAQALICVLHI